LRSNETFSVAYEARCEERCAIQFSLPGVAYGGEEFSGRIMRHVEFLIASGQAITMRVIPIDEEDVVGMAQIQVDGEIRATLREPDIQAGRSVSLSTTLVPGH
jgi:hypothetical protein